MAEEEKNDNKKSSAFYAAVLDSDGTYSVREFATVEDLRNELRELLGHDVSVFCFQGVRLKISKPPLRYLMTPDGNHPLFDPPGDEIEEDTTGFLGMDPANFEEPPEIKQPVSRSRGSSAADEFFSDDDADGDNIFDSILPDPDT